MIGDTAIRIKARRFETITAMRLQPGGFQVRIFAEFIAALGKSVIGPADKHVRPSEIVSWHPQDVAVPQTCFSNTSLNTSPVPHSANGDSCKAETSCTSVEYIAFHRSGV